MGRKKKNATKKRQANKRGVKKQKRLQTKRQSLLQSIKDKQHPAKPKEIMPFISLNQETSTYQVLVDMDEDDRPIYARFTKEEFMDYLNSDGASYDITKVIKDAG